MSVSLPDRSSSRTNRHEGHDPRPRHQGDSHTRPGVFEPTAGIAHRAPRLGIFTPQNDSPQTAVAGFGRWVLSLGSIASELAGPGSMQILLGCMFLQVSICKRTQRQRGRHPQVEAHRERQEEARAPGVDLAALRSVVQDAPLPHGDRPSRLRRGVPCKVQDVFRARLRSRVSRPCTGRGETSWRRRQRVPCSWLELHVCEPAVYGPPKAR